MAMVRQILKDVTVETAKRKRICYRNRAKHQIRKDERCLVIRDPKTQSSKNYCIDCGREILERAYADLEAIEEALGA